jgi:hypothetical protein
MAAIGRRGRLLMQQRRHAVGEKQAEIVDADRIIGPAR